MTYVDSPFFIELSERKTLLLRKKYYWRMRHENGNILLTSAKYHNRQDRDSVANNLATTHHIVVKEPHGA